MRIRLYKKRVSRSLGGNLAILLMLTVVSLFMVIPLFYAVIQAFKPIDEIFAYPPKFFVRRPTLNNFTVVFELCQNLWVPFSRYTFNSLFVSVAGTLGYVVIASMMAYPLAKLRFRGQKVIGLVIVWALLFRSEVLGVPQYLIISRLHMLDTYWALLLPAMSGTFGVFLMKQFMVATVPDATLEAARIDGAGDGRIFTAIVMPSVRPAWLTLIIFTFQSLWNATGLSYIYDERLKTLPAVLQTISAGGIARAGAGAAVALLLMIPPILIFIISQSSIMETMSQSGLK
mgnify:CR=1 FL=1